MRAASLVGLMGIACAGVDGQDATIDVRDATEAECPAGGSVVITSGDSIVICNGLDGTDGANGAKGDTGATGATGATGERGVAGPRGADGVPGATGPTGNEGAAGDIGPKGDAGAVGATGATGPQGLKGDTGDVGATGAQGEPGTSTPSVGVVEQDMYCSALFENNTYAFDYWVTVMTDGTVFASAAINRADFGVSGSRVYALTKTAHSTRPSPSGSTHRDHRTLAGGRYNSIVKTWLLELTTTTSIS